MIAIVTKDGLPLLKLNIKQFAAMSGIPETTVREMARNGDLPFQKFGRRWLINIEAAKEWAEQT